MSEATFFFTFPTYLWTKDLKKKKIIDSIKKENLHTKNILKINVFEAKVFEPNF